MVLPEYFNNAKIGIVVSPSKKFIYTRAPKNAGTSIHRNILDKEVKDIAFKKGYKQDKRFDKWIDSKPNTDNYFIFTIVRNPWSRVISNYFYLKKHYKLKSLGYFLKKIKNQDGDERFIFHTGSQYPYIEANGKKYVHYIGKVENLKEDWGHISNIVGVSNNLPHSNKTSHKKYIKYYDEKIKNLVEEIYIKDIEMLNYKFGE